ncbi:hypothetical protein GCM10008995_19570 [Halobellus salinus]|uniref:Uncharacterized protein n=1 Tax=Halobellus salinus TaxID=931585 RepID=A0A830EBG8_9EURY|nr:hypothetical protein [Halobellus salinus]GGJ09746.1 hypothetical protein GCM10008995_19570 [Halobellus salinus]SMP24945.1 hypothetical protein SAMN06265347_11083 [Halobellus salinus]
MSDPSDDPDGDGDPVEWLDEIEWSDRSPSGESPSGNDDVGGDDAVDAGAEGTDGTGYGGEARNAGFGLGSADSDSDSDGTSAPSATTDRIAAALSAVRREVWKAALVHAAVEGALVAVVANLLLSLATPAALSGSVPLPGVVFAVLRGVPAVGPVAPRTVGVASIAAVGVGSVGFVGASLLRLRRPSVERFEAANPPVREALRTARDAVDGGSDTEMARRLYADVIATLKETSTLELVDARRLSVTVVLVAVVAVASVQIAVINPDLAGVLAGGSGPGSNVEQPDDDELQDGDDILGDAEDVEAGDEVENITVPGTGEGDGEGPTAPGGGTGGAGGSGEFDSQQAGYAGDERIEDAELVREYNLRIREFDDGDTQNDDDTA